MISEEKVRVGRKVSKEYFEKFDLMKEVGDSWVFRIKEVPEEIRKSNKYYQMKMYNQARSYSKYNQVDFKVTTRIDEMTGNLNIWRIV